jgi:ectoine hydroxylase-related dioxygenase (phytanoyl-CoA dioxygenase family)
MLTHGQLEFYRANGFLAVEGVYSREEMAEARAVVEEFVQRSRSVTDHTDVFDLEPGHSVAEPRVRRIKSPYLHHPTFDRLVRHERMLDVVAALLGPGIRLHGNKLNMKSAGYGSAVEWHQDFAFYPHSNDDLLAVGVALDDCLVENGCMLMVPGSHRWPILDHHQEGVFVGAFDPEREGIDLGQAVPVEVHEGGITLHHCRTAHGSAVNTSPAARRLFLMELAAADAWPCLGVKDLSAFDAKILRGGPTFSYRVKEMDIRVPFPIHERSGSIYEVQTALRTKLFADGGATLPT